MRGKTKEVNLLQEYGWFTVLEEVGKDEHGHRWYRVRCRCGKEQIVQRSRLFIGGRKCKECSSKETHNNMIKKYVGKTINDFEVLEPAGYTGNGTFLFKCRCKKCGSIVNKSIGSLTTVKGQGCINCRPDYKFRIEGDKAIGTLKDGTEFIIDPCEIDRVKEHFWKLHKTGYIISSERGMKHVKLHRFIFNVGKDSSLIIDHVSRNKLDCRMSNLRVVTPGQNSMNKSLGCKNTTGYLGVWHNKKENLYIARIGICNHYFFLLSHKDAKVCAAAYNFAQDVLYGKFAGYHNEVPEATFEVKNKVMRRCSKYLNEAAQARQEVVVNINL